MNSLTLTLDDGQEVIFKIHDEQFVTVEMVSEEGRRLAVLKDHYPAKLRDWLWQNIP